MLIQIIAPFERDRAHGGSQRATAMAERLEERGAEIDWRVIRQRKVPRLAKLRGMARLRPALAMVFDDGHPAPRADPDAVIASHSYLAPHLDGLDPRIVRVVDFHNLEWRHLTDLAKAERRLRQPYAHFQIRLMRRLEQRAVAESDLSTFVSTAELEWARRVASEASLALVPSVLPFADERTALELQGEGDHTPPNLLYVGTLSFQPNMSALLTFLRDIWPALQAAIPGLHLTVAGDCKDEERRNLNSRPGVEAVGFVEDLTPLMRQAAAAILPFHGQAGSSLRSLYFALAGIWVIGSPAAFRGLPWEMGAKASSPREWIAGMTAALNAAGETRERIASARAAALRLQRDPQPWDDLARRIAEPSKR